MLSYESETAFCSRRIASPILVSMVCAVTLSNLTGWVWGTGGKYRLAGLNDSILLRLCCGRLESVLHVFALCQQVRQVCLCSLMDSWRHKNVICHFPFTLIKAGGELGWPPDFMKGWTQARRRWKGPRLWVSKVRKGGKIKESTGGSGLKKREPGECADDEKRRKHE